MIRLLAIFYLGSSIATFLAIRWHLERPGTDFFASRAGAQVLMVFAAIFWPVAALVSACLVVFGALARKRLQRAAIREQKLIKRIMAMPEEQLAKMNGVDVITDDFGKLYNIRLGDTRRLSFLVLNDSTTGEEVRLRVPAIDPETAMYSSRRGFRWPQDAIAWTFDLGRQETYSPTVQT